MATTLAAGCPAKISFAKLGPASTATGWPGISSAVTSLIRFNESRSTPLTKLTTGTHGRRYGAASAATAR